MLRRFSSPHDKQFFTPVRTGFDRFIPYWNTFWLLAAVTLFGRALESIIGYRSIGFLFLLAVLVVGFLSELGTVLFAAVLAVLTWNFLFIAPLFTFAIAAPEDFFMCATFFLVAVAIGTLANRIRVRESEILEREARTNLLFDVTLDISESEVHPEFLQRIAARLGELLDSECRISVAPDVTELETAARLAFESGRLTGWSTDELPSESALFVPIKGATETVGVFRLERKNRVALSIYQENLVQSVCRQIGRTLEERRVRERMRENEKLRDSEQMHQTLLNSVSHELRTPLTAILSSASALESEAANDASVRKPLAKEMGRAAARLNRVVENLLDMSRLSHSGLAVKKEWHDLEDLIGVVVPRIREGFADRKFQTEIEPGLPLVEIDFRLIEHAVFNLLVNASTYSPPGTIIQVGACRRDNTIVISIDDEGPGIAVEFQEKIFEPFFRAPGSPPGGTGLGLSIVKSIAEFHGGSVRLLNRKPTGASLQISLPVREAPAAPEDLT